MARMSFLDSGKVSVRLVGENGRVSAVCISSRRPDVAAALRGLPAAKALALVPMLYSLCGKAQGRAARLALAAARGEAVAEYLDPEVAKEVAGEHLWRLLMDWPPLLGLPSQESLFVAGRRRLADGDFPSWVETNLVSFAETLLAGLDTLAEPADGGCFLPRLDAAASLSCWPRLSGDFAAAPTYGGRAMETGALARQATTVSGRPIRDRLHARIDELRRGGVGRVSAAPVAAGVGRALVETARGLLMHEIVLDGEAIADYRIVAPTEWNFHPAGTLAVWLSGMETAAAVALAPRAVLALDPCVPWTLEVD